MIYSSAAGHRVVEDFVSFEVFEHDLDGNMTKRTSAANGEEVTYEWTDFDRLKRVESSQNGRMQDSRYDVDGLRSRKLDRNGNSSKEYGVGISTSASVPASTSSVAPSVSYISGHQILGAEVNGDLQYFLTDALGTVRDVIDDSGDVIRSQEFDEHGKLISESGSGTFTPKTYQGALLVSDDRNDSGLYLMGHRHFDPELGRFISRDPIGFNGGLNLFNGAGASPVTLVDPSGLVRKLNIYVKNLPELDTKRLKQVLTCQFRHDIEVNVYDGIAPETGYEGTGENRSYTHQIKGDPRLIEPRYLGIGPKTGGILFGDTTPQKVGFNTSEIYLGSINKAIKMKSAVEKARQVNKLAYGLSDDQCNVKMRDMFVLNTVLHELGHGMTGNPGHSNKGDVMDYASMERPEFYLNTFRYPDAIIKRTRANFEL